MKASMARGADAAHRHLAHWTWAVAGAALAFCGGCGIDLEFEYLEDDQPKHAFVDAEAIEIAVGTAVGVRVTDGGSHFEENVAIIMASEAPAVLSVGPSTAHDEFVLWGVSAGSTFVSVDIDGDPIESIAAQVVLP